MGMQIASKFQGTLLVKSQLFKLRSANKPSSCLHACNAMNGLLALLFRLDWQVSAADAQTMLSLSPTHPDTCSLV
eukprot:1140718-Pelagomonas_calceolata.AAC.11